MAWDGQARGLIFHRLQKQLTDLTFCLEMPDHLSQTATTGLNNKAQFALYLSCLKAAKLLDCNEVADSVWYHCPLLRAVRIVCPSSRVIDHIAESLGARESQL